MDVKVKTKDSAPNSFVANSLRRVVKVSPMKVIEMVEFAKIKSQGTYLCIFGDRPEMMGLIDVPVRRWPSFFDSQLDAGEQGGLFFGTW